ncbi:glutamyl-tRNA reductase [Oceanobacillus sp. CAU 1775]
MHIMMVGFNFKTTPVNIREKLVFTEDSLQAAMQTLENQVDIIENVIISTCNRTEIYAVVEDIEKGTKDIISFLADWFQLDKSNFKKYIKVESNNKAMNHLYRVTTGLDSMVLGETEILGQVRDAFLFSQQNGTTDKTFNELFKRAITFGKKSQHQTAIGEYPTSISYIAVELAKKHIGSLENKKAVVVGAGKMAELAVNYLKTAKTREVTIVNRSARNAEEIALKHTISHKQLKDLSSTLIDADILISSTSADGFIIKKEMLKPIFEQRPGKPLTIIDIAVPRDIDPKVSDLTGVSLFDIDDLKYIVDENIESRKTAAKQIEQNLEEEITFFNDWMNRSHASPAISALQEKATHIHEETMNSLVRKMPDLTERERKLLHKHTKSMMNQLLKEPILKVKQLATNENAEEVLELFTNIFGIENESQKIKGFK